MVPFLPDGLEDALGAFDLLQGGLAPVYVVHFTQNASTDQAQALTSLDICTKEEKAAIKESVGGFRFDSGFGADLRRFIGRRRDSVLPGGLLIIADADVDVRRHVHQVAGGRGDGL